MVPILVTLPSIVYQIILPKLVQTSEMTMMTTSMRVGGKQCRLAANFRSKEDEEIVTILNAAVLSCPLLNALATLVCFPPYRRATRALWNRVVKCETGTPGGVQTNQAKKVAWATQASGWSPRVYVLSLMASPMNRTPMRRRSSNMDTGTRKMETTTRARVQSLMPMT